MAVMSDLVVLMRERTAAIGTLRGRFVSSNLLWRHGSHWNLLRHNFVDFPTFRNDMVVEMGHDIRANVHCWWGLVLWKVRDPVATISTYFIFVDNVGLGLSLVVTVVCRCQETFEIAHHQIEIQRVLFVVIVKFQLGLVADRIYDLLSRLLTTVDGVGL